MSTSSTTENIGSSGVSPTHSALTESIRLSRFFGKLVAEALHLEADSISLVADGNEMSCRILKEGGEQKNIAMKSAWMNPLTRWLLDRYVWSESCSVPMQVESPEYEFESALKVDSDIVQCTVKKHTTLNKNRIVTISSFRMTSRAIGIEEMDVAPHLVRHVEALLDEEPGILVVTAPTEEALQRTVARIVSLRGAHKFPLPSSTESSKELADSSYVEPLVVAFRSNDPVDAALRLSELGINPKMANVRGILCQGLAKRVCPNCARETVIDVKIIDSLPAGLRPNGKYRYMVGRGCGECGHSGYLGTIGVQGVIVFDEKVSTLIASRAGESELIEYLYKVGTRPLLEDGVRKALEGKLTFEALFEISKVIPEAYIRFLSSPSGKAISAGMASSPTAPLKGQFQEVAHSESLFGGSSQRKDRAKPMVLIAEDNDDQRAILEMVLKGANYEVVVAQDGQEALTKVANNPPDLIMTDLMMPNIDGAELVRTLKANPLHGRIPVLILTVLSDVEKEYALLDLGADDYCEKTIQRKVLLKRVENLIKRSRDSRR